MQEISQRVVFIHLLKRLAYAIYNGVQVEPSNVAILYIALVQIKLDRVVYSLKVKQLCTKGFHNEVCLHRMS